MSSVNFILQTFHADLWNRITKLLKVTSLSLLQYIKFTIMRCHLPDMAVFSCKSRGDEAVNSSPGVLS